MPDLIRLNICLIKPAYQTFDTMISANAVAHALGDAGTFYVEASRVSSPPWLEKFFGASFGTSVPVLTASAKGVFLTKIQEAGKTYFFALIFGFGRHLLNTDVIEDRFGLKVVLNSVDHKNLRSIDRTSLGSIPKQTREQMSRETEVADFGIDIEQDLVSAVTGRSRIADLGKTISGKDALAVTAQVDISNVHNFLRVCLDRYQSDDYKQNFGWIDQIKEVKDSGEIGNLDALVLGSLNSGQYDNVWMAPPELVDWLAVSGFRYKQPKRSDLKTDIDLGEFLAALNAPPVTIQQLRETPIHLISFTGDEPVDHWSAYKCLCAEVDHAGTVHVLNNGRWYQVVRGFADEVNRSFDTMPDCTLVMPDYSHASEGDYNAAAIGNIPNSYSLDADPIVYGGGHSSVEFCDIGTLDGKLIHVKRYSGSAQLSHLFAQGVVSGELFVQDAEFRRRVNRKLPRGFKLANFRPRPTAGNYEIVFAVISKSNKPLSLPFFSKVTMKNARQRLEGYGYRVSKKKIRLV